MLCADSQAGYEKVFSSQGGLVFCLPGQYLQLKPVISVFYNHHMFVLDEKMFEKAWS